MRIKSILVEMEDDFGNQTSMLLSDFKNILEGDINIHNDSETINYMMRGGKSYSYPIVNNYNIAINLKCLGYTLTETKGRR